MSRNITTYLSELRTTMWQERGLSFGIGACTMMVALLGLSAVAPKKPRPALIGNHLVLPQGCDLEELTIDDDRGVWTTQYVKPGPQGGLPPAMFWCKEERNPPILPPQPTVIVLPPQPPTILPPQPSN